MYNMYKVLTQLLTMCSEGRWVGYLALLCDEEGEVSEVVASWLAAQETLHCLVRNAVHIESERPHGSAYLTRAVSSNQNVRNGRSWPSLS